MRSPVHRGNASSALIDPPNWWFDLIEKQPAYFNAIHRAEESIHTLNKYHSCLADGSSFVSPKKKPTRVPWRTLAMTRTIRPPKSNTFFVVNILIPFLFSVCDLLIDRQFCPARTPFFFFYTALASRCAATIYMPHNRYVVSLAAYFVVVVIVVFSSITALAQLISNSNLFGSPNDRVKWDPRRLEISIRDFDAFVNAFSVEINRIRQVTVLRIISCSRSYFSGQHIIHITTNYISNRQRARHNATNSINEERV